jgi:hypothetical protein
MAGLLRKFLKFVERSLDRDPLVAAGIEFESLDVGSMGLVGLYVAHALMDVD